MTAYRYLALAELIAPLVLRLIAFAPIGARALALAELVTPLVLTLAGVEKEQGR